MPRREIGLMGYVGEAVVGNWLRERFPPPKFQVVSQIRPTAVLAKGGPYLDFGILRGRTVHAVVEVKSQDYIFEGGVNKSLKYLWQHRGEAVEFVLQDKREFSGDESTEGYLVLLAPPNEEGMDDIGEENLRNVVLFEDVLGALGQTPGLDSFLPELHEDVERVLQILAAPQQGVRIKKPFVRARGGLPQIVAD